MNCVELECSVLCPRRHCPIACCQPNLSIGELDPHFGTITCPGGGHRRYKCRSIDTDYQSNCITVTVFINTYFIMRLYLPKSKVSYVRHWKFYHHHLFFSIPVLLYPSTDAYGSPSHRISGIELGLASGSHAPS